jgi:hypothetical protein
MERQTWFNLWYVIFAVLGVLWLRDIYVTSTQVQPIPYSEFEQSLKAGEIKDIAISNNVIQGTYKNPRPDKRTRFVTTRVDPDLAKELSQYDVTYSGVVENTFLRDILSYVAPALIFFAIWFFLARRMAGQGGLGGGLLAIGKSKAKVYVETDTKVSFDDVAGVDEAKEELREVVGFLKDPKRYTRLGGHIPKGVLLVGPRARARPCSLARSPGKPACLSSPSMVPSLWRCSSAWVRPGCATSSSRRASARRRSSSSTSSTRWAARAARTDSAVSTRRSRRSISSCPRWTGSTRAGDSS